MTKQTAVKLSRRLGVALTPRAARTMAKQPSRAGGRTVSDYKRRLLEKQKLRAQYGIDEKPMANYMEKARRKSVPGKLAVGEALIQMLETRLDAVVLRGGLAATTAAARQLVTHGHVLVNGHKVDMPSHAVKAGDIISVKPQSRDLPQMIEAMDSWQPIPYLELDKENRSVKLVRLPQREEIPIICDLTLVVEHYSR